MKLRRLLIANRGEIACRIIRTARRLGIATVAVYSDADREALHVHLADEAYHIGPSEPRQSYLSIEAILEAAALGACDAIHPGYGFLSENADFAAACREADFIFVGPPPDAIRAMGAKDTAKAIMEANGVPVIPGYHGAEQDVAALARAADEIGYPVLIKAVAGGGGKGMRVVETRRALTPAIEAARREAIAAFGNGALLIERYLTAAATCRGAGVRRRARRRRGAVRARLLGAAPASEDHRGSAGAGRRSGPAPQDGRSGEAGGAGDRLRRRRHG